MKIAVIIPTYNEKENIEDALKEVFNLSLNDVHIVVVDDNSPDGTALIVQKIRENNNKVHIIQRTSKMGLGTAYIEGFKYALENGAEYIFEIDADFSHDFALIPSFLDNIDGHDLIIGSRYISNGKIANWNLSRRFISYFGNLYARFVLGVPVKDLTTGFKCYRREVVEFLNKQNISAIGYVFQIETTYHAYQQGFKIKEIPITFTERRIGKSKFSLKIIWESFWKVLRMRSSKKHDDLACHPESPRRPRAALASAVAQGSRTIKSPRYKKQ